MQRFLSLGTDCVGIQEAADSSKGIFSLFLMLSHCFLVFIPFYSHLLTSYSLLAAALNQALARVATMEAELKTTVEALKDANATKISADKVAKAVETKAKRAEKALTEAAQKQTKHEQAVVDRLDVICTSVGSKYFVLSFCFAEVTPIDMLLLAYLYFCHAAKKLEEVWKLRKESAKDPLLDAVDVLESNWKLAWDILQTIFVSLSKPSTPSKTSFLR
jgi:hypothetical protein